MKLLKIAARALGVIYMATGVAPTVRPDLASPELFPTLFFSVAALLFLEAERGT